eukprot:scaffold8744_cov57-Cylindrotheca_fusiformis.AAC.1
MVGCSHLSDDQHAGIHENFNKALTRRESRERLQFNRITNAVAGDNQPKSYSIACEQRFGIGCIGSPNSSLIRSCSEFTATACGVEFKTQDE